MVYYSEKWLNDKMSLFDVTNRDYPVFVQFATVDSISMRRGGKAIIDLSSPMPDEWLWDFSEGTLEILQTSCSSNERYTKNMRIIELSDCQELTRRIDDLMAAHDNDIGLVMLKKTISCNAKIIFESGVK